jgi:hypothetical protein
MDENTYLIPEPRVWLRVTLLILLVIFGWIGPSAWYAKCIFSLVLVPLFGTYPHTRINARFLEREWFAAFVPVYIQRVRLTEITRIETDLDSGLGFVGGCVIFVVLGPFAFPFFWGMDWLVPWLGGDYKLWLRTLSDNRILVWQGNGEGNFRCNLAVLEETFDLPVTRG